jgi:hypothetical protein
MGPGYRAGMSRFETVPVRIEKGTV